ncbi:MAG: stage III sporulation protein AF [Oscillospiraceae bacterium]|jgi:hypothetical protein|nr:stage III sporulation protein AF [Oscillospiraceae bacterium]
MDAVKQWAFALCATMIACGLAQMIMPRSNMEKTFRMVISIFFLCAVLSPIVLVSPPLRVDMPQDGYSQSQERARAVEEVAGRQTIEMASRSLEQIVSDNLAQRGINVHSITINITVGESDTPRLENAGLVLDIAHEEEGGAISKELESELGCPVNISYR